MGGIELRDVHASLGGAAALRGVALAVRPGERVGIVGPAGSGKTALARALLGDPAVRIEAGEILLAGASLAGLSPAARARRGILCAWDDPVALPGVTNASFLRAALGALRGAPVGAFELRRELEPALAAVGLDPGFPKRAVNEAADRAARRRAEALLLALARPRAVAIDALAAEDGADALAAFAAALDALPRAETAALLLAREERALAPFGVDRVLALDGGRLAARGAAA